MGIITKWMDFLQKCVNASMAATASSSLKRYIFPAAANDQYSSLVPRPSNKNMQDCFEILHDRSLILAVYAPGI